MFYIVFLIIDQKIQQITAMIYMTSFINSPTKRKTILQLCTVENL